MEKWIHREIPIYTAKDGLFYFTLGKSLMTASSLVEAKKLIDTHIESINNTVTSNDLAIIKYHLSTRHWDMVKALIEEIKSHNNSAYCEQGLSLKYDFSKVW